MHEQRSSRLREAERSDRQRQRDRRLVRDHAGPDQRLRRLHARSPVHPCRPGAGDARLRGHDRPRLPDPVDAGALVGLAPERDPSRRHSDGYQLWVRKGPLHQPGPVGQADPGSCRHVGGGVEGHGRAD